MLTMEAEHDWTRHKNAEAGPEKGGGGAGCMQVSDLAEGGGVSKRRWDPDPPLERAITES